jgi:hypothetical protein
VPPCGKSGIAFAENKEKNQRNATERVDIAQRRIKKMGMEILCTALAYILIGLPLRRLLRKKLRENRHN